MSQRIPVIPALLLWLVLATFMIVGASLTGDLGLKTDNAMRLVEVRDLMAGQAWFDTVQHRMNVPYGLPMHWSHLIDAGIAGLILLFRLLMSSAAAELAAICVWPVLFILPVLLAVVRIGTRLAGRTGGLIALVLTGTCFAAAPPFQPGEIDHHNVQIALMMWFLAGLVDFDRARWAAPVAAVCACLSLAIGLETLPYVVAGSVTLLVWWIVAGQPLTRPLRGFGIALALTCAAILFGAVADGYRFAAACDTFSGLYGALGVAGGAGIAAMTAPWMAGTRARRIYAVAALAAILLALVATVGPQCLGGPLAQMDSRIVPVWLANITEAKTPFYFAALAPAYFVTGYVYAVLALFACVGAVVLVPAGKRRQAIFVAVFALVAVLVTTWQVRGLPFALLFAMPGLAACLVAGIRRLHLPDKMAGVVTAVALIIASDAGLPAAAGGFMAAAPEGQAYVRAQNAWQKACLTPAAMAPLGALAPGRVLAFINEGPAILAYTRHSVVAGPYHRDAAGILDTYDAFTGTPEVARRIVRVRGIDYVAVCAPENDYARYRAAGGPHSLLAQLGDAHGVSWLTPLPSGASAVKIWRVVR